MEYKFEIISTDNVKTIEFPIDFYWKEPPIIVNFIHSEPTHISFDSGVTGYVNVPFIVKNISQNEINDYYSNLILIHTQQDVTSGDCIHIRKEDENGDIWHGFAIINSVRKHPKGK